MIFDLPYLPSIVGSWAQSMLATSMLVFTVSRKGTTPSTPWSNSWLPKVCEGLRLKQMDYVSQVQVRWRLTMASAGSRFSICWVTFQRPMLYHSVPWKLSPALM